MIRRKLHVIIFGTSTRAGRRFDLYLLLAILLSVSAVMMESVPWFHKNYHSELYVVEWGFTILFSIEYLLRIYVSPKPLKYVTGFWGLIDLLAVIPTYLSPFFSGYEAFLIIRALRLLRIFRILQLNRFVNESNLLFTSLRASGYKITVFLFAVAMMVMVAGTIMYVVERGENGFTSIPQSIYWAVVTITTVGYGDISPVTAVGKFVASIMMITGYGIIAIPTGLITVQMAKVSKDKHVCSNCKAKNREKALFCDQCGNLLDNGNQS